MSLSLRRGHNNASSPRLDQESDDENDALEMGHSTPHSTTSLGSLGHSRSSSRGEQRQFDRLHDDVTSPKNVVSAAKPGPSVSWMNFVVVVLCLGFLYTAFTAATAKSRVEELEEVVMQLQTVRTSTTQFASREEVDALTRQIRETKSTLKAPRDQNPRHTYALAIGQYITVNQNGVWKTIDGTAITVSAPKQVTLFCRASLHAHCLAEPIGTSKVRLAVGIDGTARGYTNDDFGAGTMYHHGDYSQCEARRVAIIKPQQASVFTGMAQREGWGEGLVGESRVHGASLEVECYEYGRGISLAGDLRERVQELSV